MKNFKKVNKKIVIVFIIDFLATKEGVTGGTERQLIEKIELLNKERFKPIFLCLQPSDPNSIWDNINCEKHILNIYSILKLKSWYNIYKLRRFLIKNKVDIIETVFFDSIFVGTIAGKISGVRGIVSCRRDIGFSYNKISYVILFFLNYLTKRILVNSSAIKESVIRKEKVSPNKVDVIYNGVDLLRFEKYNSIDIINEFEGVKIEDKIVGIVANYNRHVKRIDLFIKAASEIVKTHNDVKFIIIGDGKLKPQLEDEIKKLNLTNYVIMAGRKENPVPYIKAFNIGVITSDSEGFCNAILEYMAAGIAVVATKVGGNEDLVIDGETGFLVKKGKCNLLAEKILILLNDEKLTKEMGLKGKSRVFAKYRWDKKIKEYEKFYVNLAK